MKFTRFEKDITAIKGYAEVAGDEVLAMTIPTSHIINGVVMITISNEMLDELLEIINEGLK